MQSRSRTGGRKRREDFGERRDAWRNKERRRRRRDGGRREDGRTAAKRMGYLLLQGKPTRRVVRTNLNNIRQTPAGPYRPPEIEFLPQRYPPRPVLAWRFRVPAFSSSPPSAPSSRRSVSPYACPPCRDSVSRCISRPTAVFQIDEKSPGKANVIDRVSRFRNDAPRIR